MYIYPSVHYCFLVSSKLAIPFFNRSMLLKEGIEKQEECVAEILRLPLEEFSKLILSDHHPVTFHDISELLETFQDTNDDIISEIDELNAEISFEGFFTLIPELVPEHAVLRSVDPEHYNDYVQAKFEDETVWTIPLKHQPNIFSRQYDDGDQIIKEVKNAIANLGVEMPSDFPYWRCIGKLEGVTYQDD